MDPKDLDSQIPAFMLGHSFWAISPDALRAVLDTARGALRTGRLSVPADRGVMSVREAREALLGPTTLDASQPSGPAIAVIPLTGLLTPHGSMLSWLFGGDPRGVQGFRDTLARAVANPEIASIVIDIDSPGGSVGLVPEAAADVRAAREVKPVIAVANTMAASGAYYIGAQANEFYVTPSGCVGSVGVYFVHEDWSKFNEEMGVDISYIYAGKYKTERNPDAPLSDEGRAALQADADTLYEMFLNDVAAGRGVSAAKVKSDYGEGRVLLAQNALDAGMVDGVDDLQTVLSEAIASAVASTGGASARRLGRMVALPSAAAADPAAGDPEPPADPAPAPEPPAEDPPAPDPEPEPSGDPAPEPESEPEAEADAGDPDPAPEPEPAGDPEAKSEEDDDEAVDEETRVADRRDAIDLLLN